MILLAVGKHRIVVVLLFGVKMIHVSKFKETQVLVAALGIVLNTFKTAKQKCLTHHAEVTAERIHYLHAVVLGPCVMVLIISALGERVIENLIESLAHELLTDKIVQLVLTVLVTFDYEAALELGGDFHIIISIYAQDVLHHVASSLHIHTICRHLDVESLGILCDYLHLKTFAYGLYLVNGNFLTNK